jgi:hypothetical protein
MELRELHEAWRSSVTNTDRLTAFLGALTVGMQIFATMNGVRTYSPADYIRAALATESDDAQAPTTPS